MHHISCLCLHFVVVNYSKSFNDHLTDIHTHTCMYICMYIIYTYIPITTRYIFALVSSLPDAPCKRKQLTVVAVIMVHVLKQRQNMKGRQSGKDLYYWLDWTAAKRCGNDQQHRQSRRCVKSCAFPAKRRQEFF